MKRLFLDDIRETKHAYGYTKNDIYLEEWDIVRDYTSFIRYIEKYDMPDILSFDHDLSLEHYDYQDEIPYDQFKEKTGFHCAKWLVEYCIENKVDLPKEIYVHSMNPVGTKNIESIFNTYFKYKKKLNL